jgi:hypothetical protein
VIKSLSWEGCSLSALAGVGDANYKVATPIAPSVATPNHSDSSIGPLIYDNQTRSMLQTDQHAPSVSSLDPELKTNSDGPVDVYFRPTPRRARRIGSRRRQGFVHEPAPLPAA